MKYSFLILLFAIVIASCSDDDNSVKPKYVMKLPKNDTSFVDSNNKIPFGFFYYILETTDYPSSSQTMFCTVDPMAGKVLVRNSKALLFAKGDTVLKVNYNADWTSYHASIAGVSASFHDWNHEWEIWSVCKDEHYFALLNDINAVTYIAVLKIKIDKNTGVVTVLDKKITHNDKLVIDF